MVAAGKHIYVILGYVSHPGVCNWSRILEASSLERESENGRLIRIVE